MNRRSFLLLGKKLGFGLGLLLFSCHSKPSNLNLSNRKTMKLESSAFVANELIPSVYTCDGKNVSPPLFWDEPPAQTKSLALICDDPDAPAKTWVHWVIYNLSPDKRSLPENIPPKHLLPEGLVQGRNDFGQVGYGGPCPPSGTHRYFFKLYALDRIISTEGELTKTQLEQAMEGHVLAYGELVGLYHRS